MNLRTILTLSAFTMGVVLFSCSEKKKDEPKPKEAEVAIKAADIVGAYSGKKNNSTEESMILVEAAGENIKVQLAPPTLADLIYTIEKTENGVATLKLTTSETVVAGMGKFTKKNNTIELSATAKDAEPVTFTGTKQQ